MNLSRFRLRELFWLAFCAAFIVATRVGFRLNLKIPGHAMLFTSFFLVLARGCVPRVGAATLVGIVSGLGSALLGPGGSGLAGVIRFLLPALAVDAGGAVFPRFPRAVWAGALVGAAAGATRFLTLALGDWLAGADPAVFIAHAAMVSLAHAAFGLLGGALAAVLTRRLVASGLLERWARDP